MALDWGSVPDWVGGVGSAAGVFLVYLGLRREIDRRRADEQFSRAIQARHIYATLTRVGDEVAEVAVRNDSPAPAFGITVRPMQLDPDGLARPLQPPPTVSTDDHDGRIFGDEVMRFVIAAPAGGSLARLDHVDLAFTDVRGYEWLRRKGTGQPEPVGLHEAPVRRWRWRRAA